MKARQITPLVCALLFGMACNLLSQVTPGVPDSNPTQAQSTEAQITVTAIQSVTAEAMEASTSTPAVTHLMRPSDSPPRGKLIYDVESSGTAPEKRAPYGDSYKINRFERPFLKDMTYLPDMDIVTFSISSDADWYYISIELIGNDPNNPLGIHYGVEIDLDSDGFADYMLWGSPAYETQWTTGNVQVFADEDHDTGGLSGNRSDAPFDGDGFETLIFNGGAGDPDPDLAWVRMVPGTSTQVQFAFKKSLPGRFFMLGVLADAGLKDVTGMDYNDHFTAEQAGSPVRGNEFYPLQALFAVDNVCRMSVGFNLRGDEPQGCPVDETRPPRPTKEACPPPPGCQNWDPVACVCRG